MTTFTAICSTHTHTHTHTHSINMEKQLALPHLLKLSERTGSSGSEHGAVADYFYEGRLISNAHSKISRKRDHVFKQMKVGSKVQYFS